MLSSSSSARLARTTATPCVHTNMDGWVADFRLGEMPPGMEATRGSSGCYLDANLNLATLGSNLPRFDHSGFNGSPRGIIIERTRTNHARINTDLTNNWWTKNGLASANNAAAAHPFTQIGALMCRMVEDTTNSTHRILRTGLTAVLDNEDVCFSVYAKLDNDTSRTLCLAVQDGSSGGATRGLAVYFSLLSGTVGSTVKSGTQQATVTAYGSGMESIGNGIYRCWVAFNMGGAGSTHIIPELRMAQAGTAVSSYMGNGASGLLVTLPQIEKSRVPTSIIINTATSADVTRSPDMVMLSNLVAMGFNPNQGTLVAEITHTAWGADYQTAFCLGTASDNHGYYLRIRNDTGAMEAVIANTSIQASHALVSPATGKHKVAIAYRPDNAAICFNGGTVVTDNTVNLPLPTTLYIGRSGGGSRYWNGHIGRIAYYRRRMADAELQALTR